MKKLFFIAILFLATMPLNSQMLHKGNLVGFHIVDLHLQPGVNEADAVSFMINKVIPADEKAFGTKDYFLRGVRGEFAGRR